MEYFFLYILCCSDGSFFQSFLQTVMMHLWPNEK